MPAHRNTPSVSARTTRHHVPAAPPAPPPTPPVDEPCLRHIERADVPSVAPGRLSKIRNTRGLPRVVTRPEIDFNQMSQTADNYHGTQMLLAGASLQHPIIQDTPIPTSIKTLTVLYTADTGHDVKWLSPRRRPQLDQLFFVFQPRLTVIGFHLVQPQADPFRFAPSLFAALCLKWSKRIYVVGVTDRVRARLVTQLDEWNQTYKTKATMAAVKFLSTQEYLNLPESGNAFSQLEKGRFMGQ